MNTIIRVGLMAVLQLLLCLNVWAQDTTAARESAVKPLEYKALNFNLQLKNMHLWRGYKVTSTALTAVDAHYISRDGSFKAGFWGGAGFTGEYREFDYYASYQKSGFNIAVWDINNFSDFPDADIFNYNPSSTSHFIDVTLGYQFQNKFPLSISWSTIVQGRDTYLTSAGDRKNAYSHYVNLDYRLWQQGSADLHAFVGGAFALGKEVHFYGKHPNIVNAGLSFNKELVLFNYRMPSAAMVMFSPEHKYGAIQISLNVF